MSFMVRAALLLLTLSVGPLLGGCAGAPAPSAAAPQQNAVVAAPVGSGGVNQAEHLDKPYVVVVSFDGFRADYLDRIEAPNFRRVIEAGVRAEGLVPVFPSKTFPNH
jgi:hypothetical protein